MSIEPWNTGAGGTAGCEDMPRKSIDISSRSILSSRKGGNCALFLPSGEDGFGQSPILVKGLVPCGFLGQYPKPSESFSASISAIFKVLLSLFFRLSFS